MKRSLELMRAERKLRSSAVAFTEALCDTHKKSQTAADKKYHEAELDLYAAARAYSRLAELG